MAINRKSFVLPYTVSVFREFYREHRYAFIVADQDGAIVGYSMSRVLKRLSFRGLGIKKIGHI
ncbi:MAG: ribosomal-protein-alanine acetyltransferase, partial [Theionarchaea archaeon]|nr:ribosomal-protein-alanine acetyltransferase [Theionarchaea archaeon]